MDDAETRARADAAFKAGRRDEAEALCRSLIDGGSRDPAVHRLMGVLDYHAGRPAQAVERFRTALEIRPGDPNLHILCGTTLRLMGRDDEAVRHLEAALAGGASVPLHCDLAFLLLGRGDIDGAERHYRAALAIDPAQAAPHGGLGIVHRRRGRPEEAIAAYHRALALDPAFAEAHNNLAIALQDLGRLAEAGTHFDAAIRLDPDFVQAHFHRALVHLLEGDWREGFAEYQWRWRMAEFRSPHVSRPWWDGGPLDGRTILLHAEQGFGDILQFVRFAPAVKAQGGRVVLECPSRLHRLLAGLPGIDRLTAPGDAVDYDYDVQMPLMSLPLVLGVTVESLPRLRSYLVAEPALVKAWRHRLGPRRSLRIGIAWQGNPGYRADAQRSPPLSQFLPLLRLPGVEAFSLQKGYGREQLDLLPPDVTVTDLADALDMDSGAFVDTAAVMQVMDLVVCSDSAVAHLAGALGRPVWVPLAFVPDWRFLMEGEDCVWYPTMRLFRQQAAGDWPGVFARIAAAAETAMVEEGVG
ncbi:MAG: tetratricopeptide repeat-containing glycosyltransferase family protein [Alphaproteobacteria bacterium]